MPIVCMFYGIIIRMYSKEHNPPHFHAEYQDFEASFDFDGNVVKGNLPKAQLRMVQAWCEIHHTELVANWKILSEQGATFKIEPLK